MIAILMAFSIARVALISINTYSPLDMQGNPQCNNFIFCDFLKPVNDTAPRGVRILTLNAFRYYLRTDLFTCSTVSDEYQALRQTSLQSADAFWEEVYRQGYGYIAFENEYTTRHLHIEFSSAVGNIPSWMELVQIYESPGKEVAAYKINIIGDVPVPREKTCMQNNGVWKVQKNAP